MTRGYQYLLTLRGVQVLIFFNLFISAVFIPVILVNSGFSFIMIVIYLGGLVVGNRLFIKEICAMFQMNVLDIFRLLFAHMAKFHMTHAPEIYYFARDNCESWFTFGPFAPYLERQGDYIYGFFLDKNDALAVKLHCT